MRWIWISIGTLSLASGIAGIALPLLPTTPFLLLSAFCYGKGSPELRARLLASPWLGQYISDWLHGRGIPLKSKILAGVVLLGTAAYSVTHIPHAVGKTAFLIFISFVFFYIMTRPTARR